MHQLGRIKRIQNDIANLQQGVGIVSLQEAYDTGQAIDVTAPKGPVIFRSTLATSVSPFQVKMGVATLINVTSVGQINIFGDLNENVEIITGGTGSTIIQSANQVDVNSLGAGGVVVEATAGPIVLQQSGQSRIAVDSAGAIELEAATTTTIRGQSLSILPVGAAGIDIDPFSGPTVLSNGGQERFRTNGTGVGFFGSAPVAQQNIVGSRGANAALADLLTKLALSGYISDSTT